MSIHPIKKGLRFAGIAILVLLLGVFAWTSYGQFEHPKYTSPPESVATTITGKKISIDYYAPSMHGRKIMGLTKDLALRRFPVIDEEAGVTLGTAIYVRNPGNPAQDNLVHEYFFIRDGKISGLWTSMYFLPKGSPVTSGWENR